MMRGIFLPVGWILSVSIIATGMTGHLGLQRHPRHAGLAAVEPAVGRAGALGVDAEQLALAEDLAGPVLSAASLARPPERSTGTCPTPEKNAGEPALDARCR